MSRITMYRRRNGDLAEAAGPELFLDVPESAESETKDFPSFQKIALTALRRSRPELKNRMLVVWECRGPDPVDPVNVLLAFRYCGVEGHFAKPDSRNTRMLACAESVREMAEWRAEILGDSSLSGKVRDAIQGVGGANNSIR